MLLTLLQCSGEFVQSVPVHRSSSNEESISDDDESGSSDDSYFSSCPLPAVDAKNLRDAVSGEEDAATGGNSAVAGDSGIEKTLECMRQVEELQKMCGDLVRQMGRLEGVAHNVVDTIKFGGDRRKVEQCGKTRQAHIDRRINKELDGFPVINSLVNDLEKKLGPVPPEDGSYEDDVVVPFCSSPKKTRHRKTHKKKPLSTVATARDMKSSGAGLGFLFEDSDSESEGAVVSGCGGSPELLMEKELDQRMYTPFRCSTEGILEEVSPSFASAVSYVLLRIESASLYKKIKTAKTGFVLLKKLKELEGPDPAKFVVGIKLISAALVSILEAFDQAVWRSAHLDRVFGKFDSFNHKEGLLAKLKRLASGVRRNESQMTFSCTF